MAQLTLYLDDQLQTKLRQAAEQRKVSQSQFVAELIRKATADEWPPGALDWIGSMPDFPTAEELRAGLPPDLPRELP
jgi:hypothetical protein